MSNLVPEGFDPVVLERSRLKPVTVEDKVVTDVHVIDPASKEAERGPVSSGVEYVETSIHSGIHAILPGPPDANPGLENVGRMEMDFDDNEQTDPFLGLRLAIAQESGHRDDENTVIVPKPSFEVDESDEEPITERNPGRTDDMPTWPKELAPAPKSARTIQREMDEYADAIARALSTDPDEVDGPDEGEKKKVEKKSEGEDDDDVQEVEEGEFEVVPD